MSYLEKAILLYKYSLDASYPFNIWYTQASWKSLFEAAEAGEI